MAAPATALADASDLTTVQGLSPENVTITMFDYWETSQDEANQRDSYNSSLLPFPNGVKKMLGINSVTTSEESTVTDSNGTTTTLPNASAYVKFINNYGIGTEGTSINNWNGAHKGPMLNMVEPTLDDQGYPILAAGSWVGPVASGNKSLRSSLAYLFNDDTSFNGKAVYKNATGLLQLDADGNYYYDSTKNFAEFDKETSEFTLYSQGLAYKTASESNIHGQFFPFNSVNDMYENGTEITIGNDNYYTNINYHFGTSMEAPFYMPTGGTVSNGNDMIFHFSGDDDALLYIDGVLVGNAGGIHDPVSIDVNFKTGVVTIGDGSQENQVADYYTTTLYEIFKAAGKENTVSWNADKTTFADGSEHKLKFFYLERGASASNLSIMTNIVNELTTEAEKVDQHGDAVAGANLALYAADENYNVAEGAQPILYGTTSSSGMLTFVDSSNNVLTNSQIYAKAGSKYWVLKETNVPAGYRATEDIHIQYSPTSDVFWCDNTWETGAFANAKETITAPSGIKYLDPSDWSSSKTLTDEQLANGKLYAMVLKYTGEAGQQMNLPGSLSNWYPIYGNASDGWHFIDKASGSDYAGIKAALKKYSETGGSESNSSIRELTKNSSESAYSATLSELPGRVKDYYYVNNTELNQGGSYNKGDLGNSKYAVGVYYVSNDGNTVYQLMSDQFTRQFASHFYVTDIKSRVIVQKTDAKGNPVTGAVMGLYSSDSVTKQEDGTYVLNEGAQPIQTGTTANLVKTDSSDTKTGGTESNAITMNGAVEFTNLVVGQTYYLKEISAPSGFGVNETITPIMVTDDYVYANAGSADNGVSVHRGVGTLVNVMKQFGLADGIDATLYGVTGTLYTLDSSADPTATDASWSRYSSHNYRHDRAASNLEYVIDDPANADHDGQSEGVDADSWVTTGWSKLEISQDYTTTANKLKNGKIANSETNKTNKTLDPRMNIEKLDDEGISTVNDCFARSIVVRIEDPKVADLTISKEVSGYEGMDASDLEELQNKEFEFSITLEATGTTDEGYMSYSPVTGTYSYAKSDDTTGTISFENGSISAVDGVAATVVKLKHNEKITIKDLPDGMRYIVEETDPGAGLTTKVTSSNNVETPETKTTAQTREVMKTIDLSDYVVTEGKKATYTEDYANIYKADPVAVADFQVQKSIVDQNGNAGDWPSDGASFSFILLPQNSTNPLPAAEGSVTSTTVADVEARKLSVTNASAASFGAITFTAPGTYSYAVYEDSPTTGRVAGMTYSQARYVVTYTVAEEVDANGVKTGKLVASSAVEKTYADDATALSAGVTAQDGTYTLGFANTNGRTAYTPRVTKVLKNAVTGTELSPTNGAYSFTLTAETAGAPLPTVANGNSVTVKNGDGAEASFGEIEFTSDMLGSSAEKTFVYTIAEDDVNVQGITKDPSVYRLSITVKHDDSSATGLSYSVKFEKKASADASDSSYEDVTTTDGRMTFTNSYDPTGTVALGVAKDLSGRSWQDGDSFGFSLAQCDANGNAVAAGTTAAKAVTMPEDATATVSSSSENHKASFNGIAFHDAGTYYFKISETVPDDASKLAGISYDAHTWIATVKVSEGRDDEGKRNGTLTVDSVSYARVGGNPSGWSAEGGVPTFYNSYTASGSYALTGTKTMSNRDFRNGDSFTFQIQATGDNAATAPLPSKATRTSGTDASTGTVTISPTSGSSANIDFGSFSFTQADADKTYEYTLSEVAGSNTAVGYDITSYKLKLEVGAASPGSTELNVTAALMDADDKALSDGSGFAWDNTYKASGSIEAYAIKTLTGREGQDGETYSMALIPSNDAAKNGLEDGTITMATAEGASYDSSTYKTTVSVSAPTDGTSSQASFGTLTFTKANAANESYNFIVVEGIPDDATNSAIKDGNGNLITFKDATDAQKQQSGWTYKGVNYSSTVYNVRLVVSETGELNEDGTAKLQVTKYKSASGTAMGTNDPIEFRNVYTPEPTSTTLSVQKTLTGRDWNTADAFSFTITAASGDGEEGADSDEATATKTAVEYGDVVLPTGVVSLTKPSSGNVATSSGAGSTITFKKAGTYKFAVAETLPTDDDASKDGIQSNGVTYDQHTSYVTVVVSDDAATGALKVKSTSYSNSSATTDSDREVTNTAAFTNSYDSKTTYSAAAVFNITKTLNGRTATADQFTFEVVPQATATGDDTTATTAEQAATKLGLTAGTTSATFTGPTANGSTSVASPDALKNMSFSLTDAGKTYTYLVREQIPTTAHASADGSCYTSNADGTGYKYENIAYKVQVTATDGGFGNMTVKTVVTKVANDGSGTSTDVASQTWMSGTPGTINLAFANAYTASGTLSTQLTGQKYVVDASGNAVAMSDLSGFTFRIEAAKDANGTADSFTSSAINNGWVTIKHSSAVGLNDNGYLHVSTDATGKFDFGTMSFTHAGTYKFQVEETVVRSGNGWTKSAEVKYVTVEVTDSETGDGNLSVGEPTITSSLAKNGDTSHNNLNFTNVYQTTQTDPFRVKITKAVSGGTLTDGVTFELVPNTAKGDSSSNYYFVTTDGSKMSEQKLTINVAGPLTGSHDYYFGGEGDSYANSGKGGIVFTKAGTYYFTAKETSTAPEGWSFDEHEFDVMIEVTDVDSKLEAKWVDEKAYDEVFSNTYGTSTTYATVGGLQVTKQLDGATMYRGEFSFTLSAWDGISSETTGSNGVTQTTTAAATAKLEAANEGNADATVSNDGVVAFTNNAPGDDGVAKMDRLRGLTFSNDTSGGKTSDVNRTYSYKLVETRPAAATAENGYTADGMTYDAAVYRVDITVKQAPTGGLTDSEGKVLVAENQLYTETTVTKYAADGTTQDGTAAVYGLGQTAQVATVSFSNSYSAEGEATIAATKTLTGRKMLSTDGFTFNAKDIAGKTLATGSVTAEPDADGVVAQDGAAANVTFSTIKFTTVDHSVKVGSEEAWSTYYKTNDATGVTTVSLPMAARAQATYTDGEGITTTTTVARHHTGVDGTRIYDYWVFDLSLNEDTSKLPASVTGVSGAVSYEVALTVTDGGNGALSSKVTIGGAETTPNFQNSYTPAPSANWVPEVTKVVKGVASTTKEFSFKLYTDDKTTVEALASGSISAPAMTASEDGRTYTELRTITGGITAGTDNAKTVEFVGMSFKKAGTYTFYVSEVYGEDDNDSVSGVQNAGWTMDEHAHKIVVKVTDDGGTLKVAPEVGYDDLKTFTNTYGSSASVDVNIAKTLTGNTMTAGQFSFSVTAGDAAAAAKLGLSGSERTLSDISNGTPAATTVGEVSASATSTSWNGTLSFTQADAGHTFTYTVKETVPDGAVWDADANAYKLNGYIYDNTEHTITVTPSDDGAGNLTLAVMLDGTALESSAYADGINVSFANRYSASPSATYAVGVVKKVEGADFTDTATFTMAAADDDTKTAVASGTITATGLSAETCSMTASTSGTIANGSSQAVHFAGLTFRAAGTYTFKITENAATAAGWTYAANTYTVKVKVEDVNGTYKVTATTEGVDANEQSNVFTNSYSTEVDYSAAAGIKLTKKLTGRDVAAGDFEWTLKATDEASAKALGISATDGAVVEAVEATDGATTGYVVPLGNATDGAATQAGGVKFTTAGGDHEYSYTLKETEGGSPVAVYDAEGNLTTGGYINDATEYAVTIATKVDASTGAVTVTTTLKNATTGEQVAKTVVASTDAATTAQAKAVTAAFTNAYVAPSTTLGGVGSVKIEATKVLANKDLTDGEFSFTVTNTKDTNDETKVVATGTNAADGTISFTGIDYTVEKLSADYAARLVERTVSTTDGGTPVYTYTYTYQVAENDVTEAGVTRVTNAQTITVTVTDKGDGSALAVAVAYPKDAQGNETASLTFKNVYGESASAQVSVAGHKTLAYASSALVQEHALAQKDIEGKYEFTITGVDQDGNAVGSELLPAQTTATNDASGNVTFGEITYTMENVFGAVTADSEAEVTSADDQVGQENTAAATRTKTFAYTVTESGEVSHVANDATAATGQIFTVEVTDNGDGTISVAKSTAAEDFDFHFTNTYDVDSLESAPSFSVTKELAAAEGTARAMQAGEFEFALYELDVEGNRGEEPVSTGVNDAEGSAALSAVTFGHDDLGTHSYQLVELNGGLGGVSYDAHAHNVTAQVLDNGDGTLGVTWTAGNGSTSEVAFTNGYEAKAAYFSASATKRLTGRDLADGEFSFQLLEGDEVLATATNAADGSVVFEPIAYTEVGEHDYTLVEVKGSAEGVSYDEAVYAVHVTVTDDGAGQLVATATYNGAADLPVFTNTYTPTGDSGGDTPTPGGTTPTSGGTTPDGTTPDGGTSTSPEPAGNTSSAVAPAVPYVGDINLSGEVIALIAAVAAGIIGGSIYFLRKK